MIDQLKFVSESKKHNKNHFLIRTTYIAYSFSAKSDDNFYVQASRFYFDLTPGLSSDLDPAVALLYSPHSRSTRFSRLTLLNRPRNSPFLLYQSLKSGLPYLHFTHM